MNGDPEAAARVFAFYLPQFHPTVENDAWWGAGFTEWTNVSRAQKLFPGHVQPRLPADLGFYDLRVLETRIAQAELARANGVEGFCYWHYWFGHGRRILERPFEEVLDSKQPNFPFSFAWANHSWTGIWSGKPGSMLLKQEYPGRADELAHFTWARRAFEDPRYQCVDGKPVFAVFAPNEVPPGFIDHWRELAHKAGYPGLYFVAMTDKYQAGHERYRSPAFAEYDAVTPHPPYDFVGALRQDVVSKVRRRLAERRFGHRVDTALGKGRLRRPPRYDYADAVEIALRDLPDERRFLPAVMPGWDNTPRSGVRGIAFENATPELFRRYVQKAVDRVANRPAGERIIFLKAWNEWAEGNYMEPDALYGHAFLNVLREVIRPAAAVRSAASLAEAAA
ncbi:MAG: glycosyltransferase WbsX family protein [Janthinobacterium lividum]